jgi:hypothetical protein
MPHEKQTALALPIPEAKPADGLDCWALVELFGHQRIVGKVSTQVLGAAALLRVDVPNLLKDGKIVRQGFTRFYGPAAIYSLTPVDEAAVRELLPMISGEPIKEWEYRFPRGPEEAKWI